MPLVLSLAMADLRHEKLLAFCTVLSLAAVLAPLIVLAGLRAGVVEGLRDLLLRDPRAREITTAANRDLPATLLRQLAARPDVGFLAPRTRTLSATLLVQRGDGPAVRIELIPTGAGDPLLPVAPAEADTIVLTASAAARLGAAAGNRLDARLARIAGGQRESIPFVLRVAGIAPPAAFGREAAFVTLPLAVFVEDFQDGKIGAAALDALPPVARPDYAGFRLYARTLEDVPPLDAALRGQGIEVVSRAADVAGLLRVDRNLTLLFALVAGLGGAGFLVSLGAGLWANVARKRAALAQLRFLGLRAASLAAIPMMQSALLAALGTLFALGAAAMAAVVVNRAFAGTLALDRPLCLISPGLAAQAAAATLAGAVLVATAAGTRASRVEPWEGLAG